MTGVWVGFDQPRTIVSNGYAAELAVPIWGGFMKMATKGRQAGLVRRSRANVVGVNVCRMSGKLPNYGCSSVETIDEDGFIEMKSRSTPTTSSRGRSRTRSARCIRAGFAGCRPCRGMPPPVPTTGVTLPAPPNAGEPAAL